MDFATLKFLAFYCCLVSECNFTHIQKKNYINIISYSIKSLSKSIKKIN